MIFNVQRVIDDAIIPKKATKGSSGYDLYTPYAFDINPGVIKTIDIGIRIGLRIGYEAQIRPRSGLAAKHGITVLNSPGTIDSDYKGNIGVILVNHSRQVCFFDRGDRIAQMVISRILEAELIEKEVDVNGDRGESGFGSTGK